MRPPSHSRTITAAVVTTAFITLAASRAHAAGPPDAAWPDATAPTPGPARVIGNTGGACLTGAVPLPLEGVGYQAMDVSRGRYYGHPALVGFVTDLGRAVAAQGLGTMLVSDMAQPRGGPMTFGHVSHQGGLDVDIWFRLDVPPLPAAEREGLPEPSVIDPATGRPDPARWTDATAELVHQAALDPRVSRIFVGAGVKRDLCERSYTDRRWLRVVRPWPRHDDHLHVRLRCPPGSTSCADQPELPAGEGCGAADLQPAFARERAARHKPAPEPRRVASAACEAILGPAPRPVAQVRRASHLPHRAAVSRLSARHAGHARPGKQAKRAGRGADRAVVVDARLQSRQRDERR